NVGIEQRLGETTSLKLQAKNLTDPTMRTVYRSAYIGPDITKTSHTEGIDISIGIGGTIRF
ncbi:MAG: hypothetical protein KDC98_21465, partial [Planctomycetes bacterium]|nr:hypothetical protein [Planctomycetota bacterium]